MKQFLQNSILHIVLAVLIGFGLGLAYSWLLAPVTYVDAHPALLRADFKDQYRIIIAASYASNKDLPRAKARLDLLGDVDPVSELSAQAQRMLAAGESFDEARPLAQLATDLQQGYVSEPFTPTPFPTFNTPNAQFTSTPTESGDQPEVSEEATFTPAAPTLLFEQTPITPIVQSTLTQRPTFTPTAGPGAPFALVNQETVCDPGMSRVMQFMLLNSKREQVPGAEIIVTWSQGEDRFFTGFKPELGNGYADFLMESNTTYNIRVVTGGAFVADMRAPDCTDPNGATYSGGLVLTFQQP
ncbi:MAG TPA: hypothetical protein PKE23_02055 [Anaerolineales bacterium]|nr:hypothetical protein [Anaerolineales bacterium]